MEQKQTRNESPEELRAALDELFERFQFIEDPEDQTNEFILLCSTFSDSAQSQAVLLTFDDSQRLPIHLACDKNASVEVIRYLLAVDTTKSSLNRPDCWGDLALHTACSRQNTALVQLLLESSNQASSLIRTKDQHENLPLHMACRYKAPTKLVRLLLNADDPQCLTLLEKGMYGQLPIHIACRCDAPTEVLQVLLECDASKTAVGLPDNVGRLPVHLSVLHHPSIPNTKVLMQGMLYGLMERLGLIRWKVAMNQYLQHLNNHERNFMASERLQSMRNALMDLKERVVLLELVCWKVQMHLELSSESARMAENRTQCRIQSGAEMILPGVLRYMEDEPIDRVAAEFF